MRSRAVVAFLGFLVVGVVVVTAPAADPPADEWQTVVSRAVGFLKSSQNADGSWSTPPNGRGVTGIVVTGLLRTGTAPSDEPAAKGLAFIESLINTKEGHIAGDSKKGLTNYITSINVLALTAAGREDKYKPVVKNAAEYLQKIQWDDGEGKGPEDARYGGSGYGGDGSRPDLSNTAFFLDALKAAGVPQDDPAFRKAAVFISRCQNLKTEHNDQPWAGKINDGSFIYTAANGGETRTDTEELLGYGSMTYAGVKSMIYCGLSKEDPRVKAALGWITKNYTLDANPGMPPQIAQRGLYYYYHTFAKTMDALGSDTFEDAQGVKHNWRADLFRALAKRQNPDGSWKNANDRWMEGDPNLVTGYALMALSYCKPK
jgi:squalene-hopene/tetraprenyl-beta-curcumene cyclase